MTYGEDKTRDMIESLLPSARRKAARKDRQAVHRNARRTFRQKTHDLDNDRLDFGFYPNTEIHQVKWERRAADKVSPFIRWAEAITKDLPTEDRLPYVKKLLPDNTIGRHALSHIDYLEHFADPNFSDRWFRYTHPQTAKPDEFKENVQSGLYLLVERGLHRDFNLWMRRHHRSGHWRTRWHKPPEVDYCKECSTPLIYRGLGDEDRVVKAMFSRSRHAHEWREAAEKFFNRYGYR